MDAPGKSRLLGKSRRATEGVLLVSSEATQNARLSTTLARDHLFVTEVHLVFSLQDKTSHRNATSRQSEENRAFHAEEAIPTGPALHEVSPETEQIGQLSCLLE